MLCVNCGKELDNDFAFCPYCGTSQKASTLYDDGETDMWADVDFDDNLLLEEDEILDDETDIDALDGTLTPTKKLNVCGLHGFILSLTSLLLSLYGIVAIAGLVLSIIGLVQCIRNGGGMKGFPIAGIAICYCSLTYTFYVLAGLL